jgi:hypothetical protein
MFPENKIVRSRCLTYPYPLVGAPDKEYLLRNGKI